MDTIKLLDKTEPGMYMAVILNSEIRCPSLYMGQPTPGVYQFIDTTGIYRMTAGYIADHKIKIDQTLNDKELCLIATLCDYVKNREVK